MILLETSRFVLYSTVILLTIYTSYGQKCFDDGNEFCVDENDILSVDLLPGSFLFADQVATNISTLPQKNTTDGSIYSALNEMDYHRKRINEYMCHGYVAEEIAKIMETSRVKRRLNILEMSELHDSVDGDNVTIQDKMLADEGSSKYKNWLQRRTTLEDVYRHYAPRKKLNNIKSRDENMEEFDGEVTGYAMQAPLPSGKVGYYEKHSEGDGKERFRDHMISSSSGHNFYYGHPYGHSGPHSGPHSDPHSDPYMHHQESFPTIHEEHYYPAPYYHDHEEEHHKPHYYKGKGELSVRDFFEIALTALAFLAFGLFIIQLLMNATNNMNATTATMMTGAKRMKRNVGGLSMSYASNEELNELSLKVLRSIEAAMVADFDSGNCLRRILCEDNRHSTQTADGRRIWVPVWSLGMSWLSGRVVKGSEWSAMLGSVKASVLGLGGANCDSLYPNCDLHKERVKRRRRRRR